MLKYILILCLVGLVNCSPSKEITTNITSSIEIPKAKNIILLIGDGMGISQITAGLYANFNTLNLERFKVIGLHKSYAFDDLITDSAAGATAFACGIKTYNGAIGIDKDTIPVQTILEEASGKGKATGLIATSSIVHATPASFIAHQASRQFYELIAEDFLDTDIDYFVGGGLQFFENRDMDDRNLSKELVAKGYTISNFIQQDFRTLDIFGVKKLGFFTANDQPLSVQQGRAYLVPATRQAIPFLSRKSKNGFFLMIEGSQIDWGGHANNSDYLIKEMIEFDKAIGIALNFAEKNKETLVIVTADHECGGYSINKGSKMGKIEGAFTTDYHTGDLIPVFAYGPGSETFSGIYENTAIYNKMRAAFGYE